MLSIIQYDRVKHMCTRLLQYVTGIKQKNYKYQTLHIHKNSDEVELYIGHIQPTWRFSKNGYQNAMKKNITKKYFTLWTWTLLGLHWYSFMHIEVWFITLECNLQCSQEIWQVVASLTTVGRCHLLHPLVHPYGAYCIQLLPEKNSGYFNQSFFPMVKSVVKIMLTWVFKFYLSFFSVKVLCKWAPGVLVRCWCWLVY